ncbi:YtxH domain-containing protein [Microbacterium sp.]|uniref:YtxH domain-containing protein n=1 Tax=Microbacterium sp. TaxID=51671 RepID=UPI003A8E0A45
MRGKVGLVIGLGVGYVLGTRAGRERYEQIKEQAEKLWNLPPVQDRVDQLKDLGKSAALAVPTALWNGAVKVAKAAGSRGTAGERLDSAVQAGRDSADDVADAAKATADEMKRVARDRDGN